LWRFRGALCNDVRTLVAAARGNEEFDKTFRSSVTGYLFDQPEGEDRETVADVSATPGKRL
jgi:hypothetical protein